MAGGRFRELFKKYGKVALGVHCSVSAASITGLYIAIKNNVDVESALEKIRFKQPESVPENVGMGGPKDEIETAVLTGPDSLESVLESVGMGGPKDEFETADSIWYDSLESDLEKVGIGGPKDQFETADSTGYNSNTETKQRDRTAELAVSSGGALALAVLCNKALFPVRVPITIALTPPIARFLARRQIIKNSLRS
ncbi:uncharacterized protein [Rutidosis leptorrhynchoides]|uniref:uncharacterized protein n=1 Tax=Rutidosis leptorrhynchoides TaxID=125765 RepID=UPI003A99371B